MTTPFYLFDPASIFAADLAAEFDGVLPDLSLYNGARVWKREVDGKTAEDRLFNVLNFDAVTWRWLGSGEDVINYIRELRGVLKYPLCDDFRDALANCLALAEEEACRRLRRLRGRRPRSGRYIEWENANLLADVESVCGPGVRRGRRVVFRCCFHDDKRPSLSVDPEKRVWFCHPCGRGGGVVDWRKAIEVAA